MSETNVSVCVVSIRFGLFFSGAKKLKLFLLKNATYPLHLVKCGVNTTMFYISRHAPLDLQK